MGRLIDADYLKEVLKSDGVWGRYFGLTDKVDECPTIEPPQGEWIPSPNIMECVVCSRCNSDNLSVQVVDPPPPWYHFCPHCGAKMKGGEA